MISVSILHNLSEEEEGITTLVVFAPSCALGCATDTHSSGSQNKPKYEGRKQKK